MSNKLRIAFGCTLLDRGLTGSGIDGIGHYCQELLTEFANEPSIQIAPFSFGTKRSSVDAELLPSYIQHCSRGLLKLERSSSGTTTFFKAVDIVHATDQLIPIVTNKPLIATVMDTIPLSHPEFIKASSRHLKTYLWKKLTERSDHIITISEFSKNEIANHMGYPIEKITSIPLGVDQRYFNKVSAEQIKSVLNKFSIDRPFFLFIGSIQPRKNILRLLQAHAALPKNYAREFPIVVAGKIAWDDGQILKAIQAGVADKRCIWLNYISDLEKRSLLQATIGLAFTSLYEGFGLPILEAFASGAPVITSNCTSMPEVAQDAGILVDPYDLGAIKLALQCLIEDQPLGQIFALKGLSISQRFTWAKVAKSTEEIYSQYV